LARATKLIQQTIFQEIDMEQILINLVAGALGGVGAGKSSPTFDLGTLETSSPAWSEAGFSGRSLPCCCLPSWPQHNQDISV
jgi:hypothetical protein